MKKLAAAVLFFSSIKGFCMPFIDDDWIHFPDLILHNVSVLIFEYNREYGRLPRSLDDLKNKKYSRKDVKALFTKIENGKYDFFMYEFGVEEVKMGVFDGRYNDICVFTSNNKARYYLFGELYHEYTLTNNGEIIDEKMYDDVALRLIEKMRMDN